MAQFLLWARLPRNVVLYKIVLYYNKSKALALTRTCCVIVPRHITVDWNLVLRPRKEFMTRIIRLMPGCIPCQLYTPEKRQRYADSYYNYIQ